MNEIVKYSNEFNFLPMPKLTEREMDLFMKIISLIQEEREIEIDGSFFIGILGYKENLADKVKIFNSFADKILNFNIKYKLDEKAHGFVCFESLTFDLKTMSAKITAQKDFYELITNCQLGFTRFELLEFMDLKGKYTKVLYRLLKQFKSTGIVTVFGNKWDMFCELMQIPKSYNMNDIDKQILKPAIKELSLERNLFNKKQPIFKKLSYKKIKDHKSRGQGGKVIGIEFYFTPIKSKQEAELIKKPKSFKVNEAIYFETEAERTEYLANKREKVLAKKGNH